MYEVDALIARFIEEGRIDSVSTYLEDSAYPLQAVEMQRNHALFLEYRDQFVAALSELNKRFAQKWNVPERKVEDFEYEVCEMNLDAIKGRG